MNLNQTACDVCSAAVPAEQAAEKSYSTLSVAGWGRAHVQHHLGQGASALDLCQSCMGELAAWLNHAKTLKTQPVSPITAPEPTPTPAADHAANQEAPHP